MRGEIIKEKLFLWLTLTLDESEERLRFHKQQKPLLILGVIRDDLRQLRIGSLGDILFSCS